MNEFNKKELWQIKVALEHQIKSLEDTFQAVRTDICETTVMIFEDNIVSTKSALEKIKITMNYQSKE